MKSAINPTILRELSNHRLITPHLSRQLIQAAEGLTLTVPEVLILARALKTRLTSKLEQCLLKAPAHLLPAILVNYARSVGPVPDYESIITKSAVESYTYAHMILKGRFPLGEPVIASSPSWATQYAKDVLHGPFPAGELAIAKNEGTAEAYCRSVLHMDSPEEIQRWVNQQLDRMVDGWEEAE